MKTTEIISEMQSQMNKMTETIEWIAARGAAFDQRFEDTQLHGKFSQRMLKLMSQMTDINKNLEDVTYTMLTNLPRKQ